MNTFETAVTSVTMNPHRNLTSDGVLIVVGLRVIDYDRRIGTVVSDENAGRDWLCCQSVEHHRRNDFSDDLTECTAGCHHDHWFLVESDEGTSKSFNGSRLESRR